MTTTTGIEWTDATWNPVIGCTKVSPGCKNCYAMRMAQRVAAAADARVAAGGKATARQKAYQAVVNRDDGGAPLPQWNNTVAMVKGSLTEPYRWKKPRMVFVDSEGDLFHEGVPYPFISEVLTTMGQTSRHTYQVLTKRPQRLADFYDWNYQPGTGVMSAAQARADWLGSWGHVWWGTSIENRRQLERIIPLSYVPASVYMLSFEPLLEDLGDIRPWLQRLVDGGGRVGQAGVRPDQIWAIVGGESGPGARPCGVDWIRSLVDQVQGFGAIPFIKQLGARPYVSIAEHSRANWGTAIAQPRPDDLPDCVPLGLRDAKGGDTAEWPENLRVRFYPRRAEVKV